MDSFSPAPGFLEAVVASGRGLPPLATAVVHPTDAATIEGALDARDAGLIEPVFVGPPARIEAAAAAAGLDIAGIAIAPAAHSHAAAALSAEMARDGRVKALMKGKLHTDELLHAVLAREAGLRTDRRASHVFVLDVPGHGRPLFVTDAAIAIHPTLEEKRDIIVNAVRLLRVLGIDRPKVAVLAAVETIEPRMPATVDAAALTMMARRGQIEHALVDGPLAFDNAISAEAARAKGIVSDVAGAADLLVVPDIESGNILAKQLIHISGAASAGIVMGVRVPVMLTSRSDGPVARRASAALAQRVAAAAEGRDLPPIG